MVKNEKKFLIGPKLGDFFNCLYVVKCLSKNSKSDVYLTNKLENFEFSSFTNSLEDTYNDIYDVIIKQPYIKNFYIYNKNETVNNLIDLRIFYDSEIMYNTTWYDMFEQLHKTNEKFRTEQWLYDISDSNEFELYKDKVVINLSWRYDEKLDNLLENIIKNNKCIFVSGHESDYQKFKFKDLVEFKECKRFSELYSIIANCKFFIGTQSTPLIVAHGLFKPHLGLLYKMDDIFLKDNYNNDYFWIDDKRRTSQNFDEIKKYINIDDIKIEEVKKIETNDIDFTVNCNVEDNKVYVFCDSNIEAYVIIYYKEDSEWKVWNAHVSNFTENDYIYWYSSCSKSKHLKNLDHIRVKIYYDHTILKDEILKIKPITNLEKIYSASFKTEYDLDSNRVMITCDSKIDVYTYIYNFSNLKEEIINCGQSSFNNNTIWYEPIKELKDLDLIKIKIKNKPYTNNIYYGLDMVFKEIVIKIRKPLLNKISKEDENL